jgi:hypothetical protein
MGMILIESLYDENWSIKFYVETSILISISVFVAVHVFYGFIVLLLDDVSIWKSAISPETIPSLRPHPVPRTSELMKYRTF